MDNLSRQKYRAALGRAIRNEREAQGLSLRKFGLMTGLDYKRIHEIEHGVANATIGSLLSIAEGLDVPFSTLVCAAEEDLKAEQLATTPHAAGTHGEAPALRFSRHRPKYDYAAAALPQLDG